MSRGLDWEKASRAETYHPSVMAEPATQRQLDYILGLSHIKNYSVKLPKTKRGAANIIDQLLGMPDVNRPIWFENGHKIGHWQATPGSDARKELLAEIRETFPQLTPMTVSSMVQIFSQIDELGMAFTFDALMHEDAPDDPSKLILHMLRRFLEEFSGVTDDDTALAAG